MWLAGIKCVKIRTYDKAEHLIAKRSEIVKKSYICQIIKTDTSNNTSSNEIQL